MTLLPPVLWRLGLSSRSPLSETKSTSSSLSALSDSLNSSEGGDLAHANEELRGLLALPSSAGSQSSSGSHSGSGTEDKPDKGERSAARKRACVMRGRDFRKESKKGFLIKNKSFNVELSLSLSPLSAGFECVFCNFVCKTHSMYERHLQIHLITRMFECDVCHKFLKTPEQLLEHKKCHTVPSGGLK